MPINPKIPIDDLPDVFDVAHATYLEEVFSDDPITPESQNKEAGLLRTIQQRLSLSFYSAREFGVQGDGVIDDTANLTTCFANGVAIYYMAPGTYLLSGNVPVTTGSIVFAAGVTLVGGALTGTYTQLGLTGEDTDLPNGLNVGGTLNATTAVAGTLSYTGVFTGGDGLTLANSATPSVAGRNLFFTGGTTAITNFTSGVSGQRITIRFDHITQVTHNPSLVSLRGSTSFNGRVGDVLELMLVGSVWQETDRKVVAIPVVVSIHDLGFFVAGDGVTDDTAAITSALAAAANGSYVYFDGDRNYLMLGTSVIANKADLTVDGRGALFTITEGFQLDGTITRCKFSNFRFNGVASATSKGFRGFGDTYTDLTFDSIHAVDCGMGIELDNIGGLVLKRCTISNSRFIGCVHADGAIQIKDNVTTAMGVVLVNNTFSGTTTGNDINFRGDGFVIAGNNIDGTIGAASIFLLAATNGSVVANTITEVENSCISLQSVCEDITVVGNNCIQSGTATGSPIAQAGGLSGIVRVGNSLNGELDFTGNLNLSGSFSVSDGVAIGGDATPSVLGLTQIVLSDATVVTNFDDGEEGQLLVITSDAATIQHNANILLSGNVDWVATGSDFIFVMKLGTLWRELTRRHAAAWFTRESSTQVSVRNGAGDAGLRDMKLRSLQTLGAHSFGAQITLPVSDATPTVLNGASFATNGAVTITQLDDGVAGQIVHIECVGNDISLTHAAGVFDLAGRRNFDMVIGDSISLLHRQGNFRELGRSSNVVGGATSVITLSNTGTPTLGLGSPAVVVATTSGTSNITNILGGRDGQVLRVFHAHTLTYEHNANITLFTGANTAVAAGRTIDFLRVSSAWKEVKYI